MSTAIACCFKFIINDRCDIIVNLVWARVLMTGRITSSQHYEDVRAAGGGGDECC